MRLRRAGPSINGSMLTVAAGTDAGRVRKTNEDACLCDRELGLVAVADGMGGHNAGDVASRLALQSLHTFLRESAGEPDIDWPCAYEPRQPLNTNRLLAGFRLANNCVREQAATDVRLSGMGTTMVAALLDGPSLTFASVGDSRLYHLRRQRLRLLTRDDSWVSALSRQTLADESTYKDHPMRHVVTNVIGGRASLKLTVSHTTLQDRDTVLLCSDGLYRALPESVILKMPGQLPDLQQAVRELVRVAVECDGSDNISAVAARYLAV